MTTKSGRVSVCGKTFAQYQAEDLGLTTEETKYYALISEASKEEFFPG